MDVSIIKMMEDVTGCAWQRQLSFTVVAAYSGILPSMLCVACLARSPSALTHILKPDEAHGMAMAHSTNLEHCTLRWRYLSPPNHVGIINKHVNMRGIASRDMAGCRVA